MAEEPENRRPLSSRNTGWARKVARWLAATSVTPNQISMAGMVAAFASGLSFWCSSLLPGQWAFLLMAALFCQLRLLCNLFDGMVAIEAGRAAPDGGFWNEFPDRVSDLLIIGGMALATGSPDLGWAAVSFAFLTAYVRELGVNCGTPADFAGPMAKQHRMAVVTAAAVISAFERLWGGRGEILEAALWIIAIGAALTALRRSWRLVLRLRNRGTRPERYL
ncbi:CDP-alcohol phosphatidyltransferase family protein [Martelella mangrovi]|uniref:Phosphatidylglycerophosphate synthase n=1 Tax=Martelella mangrovi TaxID=1397477 RepID=A0ABV2IGL6_9HYPH